MKQFLISALFCLLASAGMAQHSDLKLGDVQGSLIIKASGNEQFFVTLNGRKQNHKPQSTVEITNLADQEYLVQVSVVSPKVRDNKARMNIRLNASSMMLRVTADPKTQKVTLSHEQQNCGKTSSCSGSHTSCGSCPHHSAHAAPAPAAKKAHAAANPVPVKNEVAQRPAKASAPKTGVEMNTQEFGELCKQVLEEKYSENKMQLAKSLIATRAPFTVAQIGQMAKVFEMDKDRLEFLRYGYKFCADPEHYLDLSSLLTFDSNRQKFQKFVKDSSRR